MSTIPHSVIVKCYCREGSAADVAVYLNKYYGTNYMTPHLLERLWAEELEINGVLRGLGPRPLNGFPRCDKTILAERLVGA